MPSLILKVTGNFAYALQIETEINVFPFQATLDCISVMGLFLAKHHFVVVINYPVGSAVRTTDVPILNISGLYNAVL